MRLPTRRQVLRTLGLGAMASATLGTYAVAVEPLVRLRVTRYAFTPPTWTPGLRLRVAVLADVHACNPWMSAARIARIVATANAAEPDVTLLLGDYVVGGMRRFSTSLVASPDWARALAGSSARLGTYAVLGNHDWWEDPAAMRRGGGSTVAGRALEDAGIPVLENDALRVETADGAVWLAGLGDQLAFAHDGFEHRHGRFGVADLPATLARVTDDAPILLMAHEPDIFPDVPPRVSLTLSGHTHGGQVRVFGHSPMVPSRFGNRYAYGHVVEEREAGPSHLIVSGGLGCSIAPLRFGVPPEIAVLDLG